MAAINSFDDLVLTSTDAGYIKHAEVGGQVWECMWWDRPEMRRYMQREVPAGRAEIEAGRDGKFWLHIKKEGPEFDRCDISAQRIFDSVTDAAAAAEVYTWETIEHAGRTWFKESGRDIWRCAFRPGDVAKVQRMPASGSFSMERIISPRYGESYEITISRHDISDSKLSVTTFEEAAALIATAPFFLAELAGKG